MLCLNIHGYLGNCEGLELLVEAHVSGDVHRAVRPHGQCRSGGRKKREEEKMRKRSLRYFRAWREREGVEGKHNVRKKSKFRNK